MMDDDGMRRRVDDYHQSGAAYGVGSIPPTNLVPGIGRIMYVRTSTSGAPSGWEDRGFSDPCSRIQQQRRDEREEVNGNPPTN